MKSLKFKLLCAAIAVAGGVQVAHAQCPTTPTAWSSTTQTGGTVAITSPGYGTPATTCKLAVQLSNNGATDNIVRVQDTTPAAETRYRARFFVNADALTGLLSTERVKIFNVQSTGQVAGSNGILQLKILGDGAGKRLQAFAGCTNSPDLDNRCRNNIPLAAGINKIEVEVVIGNGNGVVRYWINSNVEATPTAQFPNLNNSAWVGVETANLGLFRPNTAFETTQSGRVVNFDEFESRRQTFIGG